MEDVLAVLCFVVMMALVGAVLAAVVADLVQRFFGDIFGKF
jgi:integral membrane sensor domain MASE1